MRCKVEEGSVPVVCGRGAERFRLCGRRVDCVVGVLSGSRPKRLCCKGHLARGRSFDRLFRCTVHSVSPCTFRKGSAFSLRGVGRRCPAFNYKSVHFPTCRVRQRGKDRMIRFMCGRRGVCGNGPGLRKLPTACMRDSSRTRALRLILRSADVGAEVILLCAVCRTFPIVTEDMHFRYSSSRGVALLSTVDTYISLPSGSCRVVSLTNI